jgi:hypothetical protein
MRRVPGLPSISFPSWTENEKVVIKGKSRNVSSSNLMVSFKTSLQSLRSWKNRDKKALNACHSGLTSMPHTK